MMIRVRALQEHPYAGIGYKVGDEYDIPSLEDARVMVAYGNVEYLQPHPPALMDDSSKPKKYRRRDLKAV